MTIVELGTGVRDVRMLKDGVVATLAEGNGEVLDDVTRATS
jgi:predicted NAD/FAD-binding protein